jgi:PAS domain S-box-containing protein
MDETAQLHEKMLAMNEALLLGSVRQHELTEAAEKLNEQLRAEITERQQAEEALLKAGALQRAIFNSANFSSIATDAKGVIQIFNVGAERMLGYTAAEVMNKITPAAISDPQELIARAKALSLELATPITPGFEALVFKAARGIEDIYELTYIRKDGSRFGAVVSVTALRDAQDTIIGYLLIGTDNTERQQAEEALLKAGALQRAIFNSANFSSIATDARGVIQIFNVGAERMLGYTAAEVMNKITPADISDPQELIARAKALSLELATPITPGFEALVFKASRGIEDIYELTYIRKDGTRFPAVVSVTALRDAQDTIIGYLLIGTDNTARQQAEEALVKAGALQSAIFNSANFSSIATDARGVIQIFNVGAERMLGYTAAEVMNKITPADISDPQELIARAKALSLELATPITPGFEALVFKASRGIEDIYELTYIRKDGTRFPAVVSVTALRDAQDVIIGYLLIGTDNTARQQAEEALVKAGALQSAIFNSANFSSIATDARGVIQIFNVGAERMLGYTAAEVMNKITPAAISDPQELIARAKALSLELATPITPGFEALVFKASRGIEDIYELTYIRKDGTRFPAVVSVTALRDAQDVIIGYLLIGTDNTARKQVEAERALLDQALQDKNAELESAKFVAEKANLAKSDFLSSMSHELRTPLNAILGFAQLVESGSPSPTDSQKRSIDQILQAGWYLLELINEILDLALIESGKLSLSLEPISLAEVMLECQAMIEPQAQRRGISVAFPHFEMPSFVQADRTRVKQVFINLLSNAIKYNKVGGTVVVEKITSTPGGIRICVKDSGEGLSADKLAQLFQPFNRLGQEANAVEGTGIGLVTTKRLVELMKGVIGVESTVGVGSVFWIELSLTAEPYPAAGAAEPTAVAQAQVHSGAQSRTLLYVEDNPANLMLVEDLIARRPDIRLLSARDGNRGVEIAQASRPDVILMDINLPGISGIQALRILAEDPATAHIPVIALSANVMPRDIEKSLEAGFFRYLTKPIKVNEFMDTLDVALKFAKAQSARANREDNK